jgi:hypothetical protein
MSETKGLYQVEDEPDAAPQGSVSAPVASMGKASAPLSDEARTASMKVMEYLYPAGVTSYGTKSAAIACIIEEHTAARVAEAVAQERARIVAMLRSLEAAARNEALEREADDIEEAVRRHRAANVWAQSAAYAAFVEEEP